MANVSTGRGLVDSSELGFTLMHEHLVISNPEFARGYPDLSWRASREDEIGRVAAEVRAAAEAGVHTIVDCTVFMHGRDLGFAVAVNEQVDVNVVFATGIYTFDYLPYFIERRVPPDSGDDLLTQMFVHDIEVGIEGTDIRAEIIKVATDASGVTVTNDRILRAAARAQRSTGVAITTHTEPAERNGLDQLAVFAAEGVDLSRVVVGHSGDSSDLEYLRAIMDQGSTIAADRFGLYIAGWPTFDERIDTVASLCRLGYADRIVLSHDRVVRSDWRSAESAAARDEQLPQWRLSHVSQDVIPALLERGVTDQHIELMTVGNPRRLLTRV